MKQLYYDSKLEGLGGWLALLQVRMYMGLALLFVMPAHLLLTMLAALALLLCLALFYRRCTDFRAAYVVAAVVSLACAATALQVSIVYIIVLAVLEAVMIPALFRSRRVKSTFLRRWDAYRENACTADARLSRGYDHCCYDVHMIAIRRLR